MKKFYFLFIIIIVKLSLLFFGQVSPHRVGRELPLHTRLLVALGHSHSSCHEHTTKIDMATPHLV
jgi:hypothetical protein